MDMQTEIRDWRTKYLVMVLLYYLWYICRYGVTCIKCVPASCNSARHSRVMIGDMRDCRGTVGFCVSLVNSLATSALNVYYYYSSKLR